MTAPLELHNSATGKILPAIGPLLIGAIFAFGVVQGIAAGANGGHVLVIALLGAGCLALGFFLARGAFDTSVKVVLDSQGFRDRRAGDVLVPWRKVRSVRLTCGKGSAMLNFELTEEPPDEIKYAPANVVNLILPFGKTIVHMEVSSLDVRGDDMLDAIRKFAPHVVVNR